MKMEVKDRLPPIPIGIDHDPEPGLIDLPVSGKGCGNPMDPSDKEIIGFSQVH